jgi:hypothetical protein
MSYRKAHRSNCIRKESIMQFFNPAKVKIGNILLVLAISGIFVVGNFGGLHFTSEAHSEFVNVQIVHNSAFKGTIGVNQTQSFFANVTGVSGEALYNWTAKDLNGNFSEYELIYAGPSCSFRFLSATEHVFLLTCTVEDRLNGTFNGQGSSSVTVRDPYTSAEVHLDAYPSTASYTVEGDGLGWYRAINCSTGEVSVSGTNATATIQYAIDHLTAGRNWKETIILKGDLGNVSNILLSDFVKLVGVNAKMQLPSGERYIFKQDKAKLESVEIQGIDFSSETTSSGTAIFLYYYDGGIYGYSYDVDIHDCRFTEFSFGIFSISKNSRVFNNKFIANNYGFAEVYGRHLSVQNNYFLVGDPTGATNDVGLYIIDAIQANINGNFFVPSGTDLGGTNCRGIWLEAYSKNININQNNFGDFSNAPILVGAIGRSELGAISDISINNNQFNANENSTRGAIYLGPAESVADVIIESNLVRNYADLLVLGASDRNIPNVRVKVAENQVYSGVNGFQLYGNAYQVVLNDNAFYGLTKGPIVESGILNANDNIGYP